VQRQVHNNRRGNEEFRGDGVVSEEEISENYTEKSLLEAEPVNFCPLPSSGVSVLLTGAEFNHMRNEIIALKRENERLREISEENRKLKEWVHKRNLQLETEYWNAKCERNAKRRMLRKSKNHWYFEDSVIQNFRVDANREKESNEVPKDWQVDCPSEDIAEL
jgi:hypothetical protein